MQSQNKTEQQQPWLHALISDQTLDQAYSWLLSDRKPGDSQWRTLKTELQQTLAEGEYAFQPLQRIYHNDEPKDLWQDRDRIVLKAMSLVLERALAAHISADVYHRQGGIKQALRSTQNYLKGSPDSWVMKRDVKGYYFHIDHHSLYEQVAALIPGEKYLMRLVWQYLKRSVEDGGVYHDVEHGIALDCSLSPLMAALYLKPLDDAMREAGVFYVRFLDDWVAIAPTRWRLNDLVKTTNRALNTLKFEKHLDKTFIGRVNRGFDFLGYQLTAERLTVSKAALKRRDQKLLRLYEQGGSGARVEAYLSRWERWAEFHDRLTPPPKSVIKQLATLSAGLAAIASGPVHSTLISGFSGVATSVVIDPVDFSGFDFTSIDLDGGGPDLRLGVLNTLAAQRINRVAYGFDFVPVSASDSFSVLPPNTNFVQFALMLDPGDTVYVGFSGLSETPSSVGWLRVDFDGANLTAGDFAYATEGETLHVSTLPDTVPVSSASSALLIASGALGWLGLSRRNRRSSKT